MCVSVCVCVCVCWGGGCKHEGYFSKLHRDPVWMDADEKERDAMSEINENKLLQTQTC